MRTGLLSVALIGLVAVAPAMADVGALSLLLSSTDDNGANDANSAVGVIQYKSAPAAIPLTVKFSCTASGTTGSNNGVFGVYATLSGNALGDNTSKSMTLNATFKKAMGASSVIGTSTVVYNGPSGLGFDSVQSTGTGAVGSITGFGAAQGTSAQGVDWGNLDAQYAGHTSGHPTVALNTRSGTNPMLAPNEQFAGAVGPVTMAAGSLVPAAMVANTTYTINLTGQGSLYWYNSANAQFESVAASATGSQLIIALVPEPSSLLLLSPMALLGLRRRRAA